jgi:hypothetical protein
VPDRLWLGLPREPSELQAGEGDRGQRLARPHPPFVVNAQTAVAHQPGESSPEGTRLHHPSPRLEREALRPRVAPDDLRIPAAIVFVPAGQLPAGVRPVRPNLRQAGDERGQPGE